MNEAVGVVPSTTGRTGMTTCDTLGCGSEYMPIILSLERLRQED